MEQLTKNGHPSPINATFYKKYEGKQPNWGFNGLGYITFKRTYARRKDDGTTEEWCETVRRCVEWLYDTHEEMKIDLPNAYYQRLYDIVFNLKANFSGRMLWQAGTQTVDAIGGASMCNCWAVVADCKESFLAVMDYLMLGGGVGYNIQERHVARLPQIKKDIRIKHVDTFDCDYIVPDNREGWVELLNKILTAFFETGKGFTYTTKSVRPYGEPIHGFGGTASGPKPLIDGMTKIIKIVKKAEGRRLKPVEVLDIMNCLGEIVVAGNVRRSAQIALGDIYDKEYMLAKNWSSGNIPSHRAFSNNSAVVNDITHLNDDFWLGYEVDDSTGMGKGEPYGLINLKNMRRMGRAGDFTRPDPDAIATNPCAEITLSPTMDNGGAESCNLCELYLNNIEDADELEYVADHMYYVVKTIAMLPYHRKETQDIVGKNLRLGIGLTGIVQRPDLIKKETLTAVYNSLNNIDEEFSSAYDVPKSIKLTTVKPSGTLSLLAGATPGVHADHAPYYIRRVRMGANDSLVDICRDAGYHVEYVKKLDGTEDHDTVVVEFPVASDAKVHKGNFGAIKLLDLVKHMQTYWTDNQVSCTVNYDPEELPAIKEWLAENYDEYVKTLSFLLNDKHGFAQAPYETISKKEYEEKMEKIKPIDFKRNVEEDTLADSMECVSGACPIR